MHQLFHVGFYRATGTSRLGLDGVELPADQKAVRLLARIDAVRHHAVKVDKVRARVGTELEQVEKGVATNQRIGCPFDDLHAALEAPPALVLLELEAESTNLAVRDHAKDVGVQVQLLAGHAAQPADETPEKPVPEPGSDNVVA